MIGWDGCAADACIKCVECNLEREVKHLSAHSQLDTAACYLSVMSTMAVPDGLSLMSARL
jgi:hypothetical protein